MSLEKENLLKSLLRPCLTLSDPIELFDKFQQRIDDHFATLKSTDIKSLKNAKGANKLKGDFFEYLCLRLLVPRDTGEPTVSWKNPLLRRVKNAWLFKEIPDTIRAECALSTRDMGIDIVAETHDGQWLAIQCKYRKKPIKPRRTPNGMPIRNIVTHKDVSTFNALCERTGPKSKGSGWYRQIVMTNCEGVNRQGRKTEKEMTIANKSFVAIDKSVWLALCGDNGHTLTDVVAETKASRESATETEDISPIVMKKSSARPHSPNISDAEDARSKRLAWINKL